MNGATEEGKQTETIYPASVSAFNNRYFIKFAHGLCVL